MGIDAVLLVDDMVIDTIFYIGGVIGPVVHPLVVGFVITEQLFTTLVIKKKMAVTRRMGLQAISRNRHYFGLGKTGIVFPEIAKPYMGNNMDGGCFGAPVEYCYLHQDIVDICLGIFDIAIKVTVILKQAGVE